MNSYILLFVASAILAAVSQTLLKKAALLRGDNKVSFFRSLLDWRVIVGYSLLFLTTLLNMIAYRHTPLNVGGFINTLAYVFVGIISFLVFKEKFTIKTIVAYCLIIAGVLIVVI